MKLSSETFQELPYFWNKKTQKVFFSFSFRATLDYVIVDALVYVNID